ncbi:MAG: hypothetical protein WCA20_11370 [Candidatus Sulfotelmatobacter sp.]
MAKSGEWLWVSAKERDRLKILHEVKKRHSTVQDGSTESPRSKAQIIALLRDERERWAKWLESQSDDLLAERVKLPVGMTPPSKTRFKMLLSTKSL